MLSQYTWKNGPEAIAQHSVAKHRILQAYLAEYFKVLIGGRRDEFKLTLVDGFAGGGLYYHEDTREVVRGSPLIFLDAAREAEFLVNRDRTHPVKFDLSYFFIEAKKDAYQHLMKVLQEDGHRSRLDKDIFVKHSSFLTEAQAIIDFIAKKSPRNGRSIFALDQFGYNAVPTEVIRLILNSLPGAEVILTFGVDSLLNYANENNLASGLRKLGIPTLLSGKSIKDIKSSDRDWRLFIQSSLYQSLVQRCGAKHFTPFFIRNKNGHGDYWLIHLSQHHKARDVMTQVHWQNQNYFIHYAGAGLNMFNMLGYDPRFDHRHSGQQLLGFEFDTPAREKSISALMDQIPKIVYAHDEGLTYESLYVSTCNESPATGEIYQDAIGQLVAYGEVQVVGPAGERRRAARQIKPGDRIVPAPQRKLF
ncbi:three-Cys-motif partner protein TcmP [Janthinobacterium rivuli]|uniref:three-Cys-motif partner protein TcmP n=1 Tax=Janthinobacterium sp. FT68W TaxID=2654255 RepID=UPI0012650D7B|nr:three-Cys-motif partner protein TcmP [Janthinobacterium sp. FT68W]KAB8048656.1 three-Cys-motif partner protein TcmP [Janthinobacterium sp. FT68W]